MPAGAPRTTSPSPDECIELGKHLVHWASTPPKEGMLKTNFQYWYAIEQFMTFKQWKALKQISQFLPYYEMARALLHNNMVRGDVKEGVMQRYLRYYDIDLMEGEDETKKFGEDIKKPDTHINISADDFIKSIADKQHSAKDAKPE